MEICRKPVFYTTITNTEKLSLIVDNNINFYGIYLVSINLCSNKEHLINEYFYFPRIQKTKKRILLRFCASLQMSEKTIKNIKHRTCTHCALTILLRIA